MVASVLKKNQVQVQVQFHNSKSFKCLICLKKQIFGTQIEEIKEILKNL
jgi:hypothetical protein